MTPSTLNIGRIHWRDTATAEVVCPALDGPIETDVVVVGGGLTGTRTALGLAEQGVNVILLEAKDIGWGASGRSGGQCNPIWRATPDQLRKQLGNDAGDRLVAATLDAGNALFEDIQKYDIDCDGVQNGWVQAAHCRSAQRRLEVLGQSWNDEGADISFLDAAATKAKSGSADYSFSLFHPTAGHVQPLSLTRGFARTALKFGARLFANSPVQSIKRAGSKWVVATPKGAVTASKVVLTTNAYSKDIWPKLQQTFFPLVSCSLATEPLTESERAEILPNSVTIADSRRAIFYSRYDRDHRLIMGCVASTDDPLALGGQARLKRGLRTVFPQLAEKKLVANWTGRIAVTPEMMPHLHEPESGILAGLGFSGRGIAMTSVMARTMVAKIMGSADDTLAFPVVPIATIPFHRITSAVLPLGAPAMTIRDQLDTIWR